MNRKAYERSDEGFTIIEVVLVLAVAGLIFIVVFFAMPALRRAQREQVRKNDASRVVAAVNSCFGNKGSIVGCRSADAIGLDANDMQYFNAINYCDSTMGNPNCNIFHNYDTANKSGAVIWQFATACPDGSSITAGVPRNSFSVTYWSENISTGICLDGAGLR